MTSFLNHYLVDGGGDGEQASKEAMQIVGALVERSFVDYGYGCDVDSKTFHYSASSLVRAVFNQKNSKLKHKQKFK